ncbi:MAG: hypothetical protein DRR08_07570 [Candidatus Parabeggiatoa sp. nov. 2]|nr:MAG: hypothetical protein B6247_03525 [Beggiatoa sp. 4572_84]RKZ61895.1 MAG: hypothetical protein DRR08_07570 [Gammaproteobacteria bacterium]
MPDKQLDILKDNRTDCYSVMISYSLKEYLELVESAYKNKGGLEKQRTALKTSAAKRIRERMASDLQSGAIFPPIVLGLIFPEPDMNKLHELGHSDFKTLISGLSGSLSIIDGMQRTTAMYEVVNALIKEPDRCEEYLNSTRVRVEHWIARSINSLIYRMLVLNTRQVPWNLRRQIEVVFGPLLDEIKKSDLPLKILEIGNSQYRKKSGQYQGDKLVELFLVFGLRKEKVHLLEQLADEFSRLDIKATSNTRLTEIFKEILDYLITLDSAFERYSPQQMEGRFERGRNIFDSQPARVGFIAACAIEIMGKPGIERHSEEKHARLKKLSGGIKSLLERLDKMEEQALGNFIDLTTLNDAIVSKRTGNVRDYERVFFLKAFERLIEENFEVPSLSACWRAY